MTTPTSVWRADAVARIAAGPRTVMPVIPRAAVVAMVTGLDLWDLTPVRTPAGGIAASGEDELWIALSAPAEGDPSDRHDRARLRLLTRGPAGWRDRGALFPDGASLGSREWAAHAILDPAGDALEVLYTAAGARDGSRPRFTQRIARARGRLVRGADGVGATGWGEHREVLCADGSIYARTEAEEGRLGFIAAFRDPFAFRDPADGREWLLFAASRAGAPTAFNGAVGLASADGGGGYRLEQPLLDADGVNTELERPHVVVHDGRYHLFLSTQAHTFAPGLVAPTGLYGFTAPALRGPYSPIGGTGLVLANPDAEPTQAYSWMVLPDLSVVAFVDLHSLGGVPPAEVAAAGAAVARGHFGGTIAPVHRLRIEDGVARLAD